MNFKCDYVPLTELLEFIVDNRGKTAPTSESGIPLIATNCIKNTELYPVFEKVRYVSQETYGTWFRAHPRPGDIIFVNKGTPGRVCLVPEPVDFCIAQDMMAFRVNKNKVYNTYLFAVLRSREFQTKISNYHVGTMIPHFKKGDLDSLLIPIPSMEIQRSIGDNYYIFSNKIQLNNEINKTLEEMAQALFKRWFVDFEFPNEDGNPYKSSGGEMVESELGMIPKEWESNMLKDIATITMGVSPSSSSYNEENIGLPLLNGAADFEGKLIRPSKYTSEPKKVCDIGDMVFGVRATIGNTVFADKEYALGRGVAAVSPHKVVSRELIYFNLNNSMENLINSASGSVFLNLKKADITDLKIYFNKEVVEKFHNIAKPLIDKIIENDIESEILKQKRDVLLPKLMNGEIRVCKAEI